MISALLCALWYIPTTCSFFIETNISWSVYKYIHFWLLEHESLHSFSLKYPVDLMTHSKKLSSSIFENRKKRPKTIAAWIHYWLNLNGYWLVYIVETIYYCIHVIYRIEKKTGFLQWFFWYCAENIFLDSSFPPFFLIESMFVSSSHHFLLDREPVSTVEKKIEKMEELRDNNPLSISILSSIYENNNQSDITVYT